MFFVWPSFRWPSTISGIARPSGPWKLSYAVAKQVPWRRPIVIMAFPIWSTWYGSKWMSGQLWYTVIYCDGQCWNMLDDLNLWGNYAPQIWTTAGIPWAASAEPYLDLWRLVWFLSGRPRSRDGPMYCIYGSSFLPFVSCPCVPAVVVSNCWPTKLLRLLYMTHE